MVAAISGIIFGGGKTLDVASLIRAMLAASRLEIAYYYQNGPSEAKVIDIYRIKFPKDRLRAFSSDERAMFFLLGHAVNQIAVFRKLVIFATNISRENRHVQSLVEGAQTQILVRHFIGVVSEAWELVNRRFIQKPIGKGVSGPPWLPRLRSASKAEKSFRRVEYSK